MEENENARLIDSNDSGELLYSVYCPAFDTTISVLVEPDGEEYYPEDFQGMQPDTIDQIASGDWMYVLGEDIDF